MQTLNLNLIAVFFLTALLALTSCQKEDLLADIAPTNNINSAIKSDRSVPAAGIHFINEDVTTQASLATIQNMTTERSRYLYAMECGSDYRTSTIGEGSSASAAQHAKCADLGSEDFAGEDMVYYLSVEESPAMIMTYTIKVSELEADLDLFVYALDNHGNISECKAASITIGTGDETITLTDLAAGCYYVIVDGYRAGEAGAYRIALECSAVSANPPSVNLIETNRVLYSAGVTNAGFYQTSTTNWMEIGTDGTRFYFTEVNRDEWSVYLRDDSRGVNIQLDLHTQEIKYSDDQGNAFLLAAVAQSTKKVHGYLASKVTYNDGLGIFAKTSEQDWVEVNSDGNHHFTEVSRDEWSVYLRDAGRGVNIQLDLHTLKVNYRDDEGNAFELYEITAAE